MLTQSRASPTNSTSAAFPRWRCSSQVARSPVSLASWASQTWSVGCAPTPDTYAHTSSPKQSRGLAASQGANKGRFVFHAILCRREPRVKSSQEDRHVLRGTIFPAADNDEGPEARRAAVCDRPPAAELATRSREARDGQAEGSRARAGDCLSG